MGRRGATVKDVVPKVSSDAKRGSKIVFGEDDDENETEREVLIKGARPAKKTKANSSIISSSSSKTKPTKKNADSEKDGDTPEEISAQNEEIIKRREWHERLITSTGKVKRKRKDKLSDEDKSNKRQAKKNADEALDASVLEALTQGLDNENGEEEGEEGEEEENEDDDNDELKDVYGNNRGRRSATVEKKIDTNALKSKKLGDINVAVLNSKANPLAIYKVSESAKTFSTQVMQTQPRVRYTLFAAQKRAGPAKTFAAKR